MKMNLPWPYLDEEGFPSYDALEDLDEIQNLPFRENRKEYITRKYGDLWNIPRFDYPRYSHSSDDPYVKRDRVIKKFLGKSFDDAFSYYCTLVPKYRQGLFLEAFEINHNWYTNYIVDKNRCIKVNPKKPVSQSKPAVIYSGDFKVGYRLIEYYQNSLRTWISKLPKELTVEQYYDLSHPDNLITRRTGALQKFYKSFIIEGTKTVYKNKHDRKYIRLTREKIINSKRESKKLQKARDVRIFSFLTEDELQKRMDWKEGILVRDHHGFDKNSFKVDPYHGQQRKNKL